MDAPNEVPSVRDDSAWSAFLGGLRTSLAHDLRTPLGTIANYAAVLEHAQDPSPSEVQNVAQQIRRNVMRTVAMLERLATASSIATSAPPDDPADVRDVLSQALADAGARSSVRESGFEEGSTVVLDRPLLQFALSAYVTLERDANGQLPESVDVRLEHVGADTCLTLTVGLDSDSDEPVADLTLFLVQAGDRARLESRHALRLADQLVRLRGGTLELRGRAGNGSTMRLCLPSR